MERDHWDSVARPEQIVPPGAAPVPDAVERLQALLDSRAPAFVAERFGSGDDVDLRLGQRGLLADEAASFVRALDAGLVSVDPTGGVRVDGCRPKPGGGRYALFSANRFGGDLYVSLNLEYLIQIGAACELVAFWGWPGADVDVEVGEFDAVARAGERVVLAMEAKARIDGPDSLHGLWSSLVEFASRREPPEPKGNHARKYVELLRLAEPGPVVLWLVAAQARWPVLASRVGSRVDFTPFDAVDRSAVVDATARVPPVEQPRPAVLTPRTDHAVAVAGLTELDGQQRCYEFPWRDDDEFDGFLSRVRDDMDSGGLAHARAWKWRSDTSGGSPLSPSGRATGLELRFSYYAS